MTEAIKTTRFNDVEYDEFGRANVDEFEVGDLIGGGASYEITASEWHPQGWCLEWRTEDGIPGSGYRGSLASSDIRWVQRIPKFIVINELELP